VPGVLFRKAISKTYAVCETGASATATVIDPDNRQTLQRPICREVELPVRASVCNMQCVCVSMAEGSGKEVAACACLPSAMCQLCFIHVADTRPTGPWPTLHITFTHYYVPRGPRKPRTASELGRVGAPNGRLSPLTLPVTRTQHTTHVLIYTPLR